MKVVYEYSHLGGSEILKVRFPEIEKDIKEIISEVKGKRIKESKEKTMKGKMLYSPKDMNQQFKEAFESRGYRELKDIYTITLPNSDIKISNVFKQIDFVKDKVLIEVQFGKYALFQYFFNENKAEVGIEIVPCHALHEQMSDVDGSFLRRAAYIRYRKAKETLSGRARQGYTYRHRLKP